MMSNSNGIRLLKAVEAQQQGKLLTAEANLQILLNNAVGIGEHTNVVADVLCFVEEISVAEDNLRVVKKLLYDKSLTDDQAGLAGH